MNIYHCPSCGSLWQDIRKGLGRRESLDDAAIAHRARPYGHRTPVPEPEPEPRTVETRICWRCERDSERRMQWGQALVEMAIGLAIMLPLAVVAADLGIYALHTAIAQGAAESAAEMVAQGIPTDDPRVTETLARADCPVVPVVVTDDPVVWLSLSCPYVSLTSTLGDVNVEASAVMREVEP